MIQDPAQDPIALWDEYDKQKKAQATREKLVNSGSLTDPVSAAKSLEMSAQTGQDPISLLDPEIRAIYEKDAKITGLPMEFFAQTKTAKWSTSNSLRVDMTGVNYEGMLTLEEKAIKAERERVDIERKRKGQDGIFGAIKSFLVSLESGGANLLAIPHNIERSIAGALISDPKDMGRYLEYSKQLNRFNPVMRVSEVAADSAKFWSAQKREQERLDIRTESGRPVTNWGSLNPFSLHGFENLLNMAAEESGPQVLQTGLALALTPETGGASLAALPVGKFAKAARLAKRLYLSPVGALNTARVISGQADQGVQELMQKNPGMTEAEAWTKVGPGALLAGVFSSLVGSPVEAKVMEDLFTKVGRVPGTQTMLKRWASRAAAVASQGTKEGFQEVLEGIGEDLAAYITYSPDKTVRDFALSAIQNFAGGFAVGGPTGGVVHGSQAIQAANQVAFIQALNDEKTRIEFTKHAPSEYANFVTELTKGGDLENLAVDAQGLTRVYQGLGEDARRFATTELGVSPEDYDMAMKTGGDLIIPTGLYAKSIAGTEAFGPVRDVTRVHQGGPTISQLQKTQADEKAVQEMRDAIAALPTSDPTRDTIREKIVDQLRTASRVFTDKQADDIADHYAKVIMVLAQRSGKDPLSILETHRLNITRAAHAALDQQKGEGYGLTGPEIREAAAPVQGAPEGRGPQGIRTEDVGVPGQGLAAAAPGLRRGTAPPAGLWHGTEARGFGALRAEGLQQTSTIHGGMGPGLHASAGPDVALNYANGQEDGLWQVGLRQNYTPFDAAADSTYTPEEAAQFGVEISTPLSGLDMWQALITRLGSSEAAAEFLKSQGFDGLYYRHGGEDAWSVWSEDKLVGSKPTSIQQAQEVYARQGSRRDPVTGQLVRMNQSPGRAGVSTHRLVVERQGRVEDENTRVSSVEKAIIKAAAAEVGMKQSELEATVRETKQRFPMSDGWSKLELSKIVLKKGKVDEETGKKAPDKIVIDWKVQPYQFDRTKEGKTIDPTSPEYKRRVSAVAKAMRDEVLGLYRRAQSGDTNAANIIAQSGWYREMRTRLRHEFGGMGDLFADLLGATSPNTPVRENWKYALDILRRATRGDFDQLMPAWLEKMDAINKSETELLSWVEGQKAEGKTKKSILESAEYKSRYDALAELRDFSEVLPLKETGKKYGFNGYNAIKALTDMWRVVKEQNADIGRGATAPKALNFSGNLIGFRERATIDVWAARMLNRLAGMERIPVPAEGGVAGLMLPSGETAGQFRAGQDMINAAVGLIKSDPEMSKSKTLSTVNDDNLQAVVWFLEKELWTKNNWTSAAGEGGSFELEANLAGSDQLAEIARLRKIMDSSKSTVAQRTKARSELDVLHRSLQRYTGGLSIQQSASTQGLDFVPSDGHQAIVQQALKEAIYSTDMSDSVMGSKVVSTVGRYMGEPERSIDLEVVAREGFSPDALHLEMLKQARDNNQQSMFISRVVRAEEQIDPTTHRPGVEVYFRNKGSVADMEQMLSKLHDDFPFYTVVMNGRPSPEVAKGADGDVVGIRVQYMPEFTDELQQLKGLSDVDLAAKMEEQAANLESIVDRLSSENLEITSAQQLWYETEVTFLNRYQEKIDEISSRLAGTDNRTDRGQETRVSHAASLANAARFFEAASPESEFAGEAGGGDAARLFQTPRVVGPGTFDAVHYSGIEGLTELSPAAYGTGSAGREKARVDKLPAGDPRKQRVYLYEKTGEEMPAKERVVKGSIPYFAQVNGVYDLQADPDGLKQKAQAYANEQVGAEAELGNAIEKMVLDAGYKGYISEAAGVPGRAIVMLGPDAIQVRSEMRQTTKPVDTSSPEFKAWFGNSKAVWEDGAPRVFYHGTHAEFDSFIPKGEATGNAIFFSTDPGIDGAGGYNMASGGRTISAYLKIEKPFNFRDEAAMADFAKYLDLDAERIKWWQGDPEAEAYMTAYSGRWDYMESPEFQKFLRERGYDSFYVIENGTTNIGVLSPTQIKSAISNTGAFDPNNPSILYQKPDPNAPRGYLEFTNPRGGEPRQFNMVLLENENKSTVFHELGHFYLELMRDLAAAPDANQQIKDDVEAVMRLYGKDGKDEIVQRGVDKDGKPIMVNLTHERFADAHLAYLETGKAPTKELVPAFKRFSKWLAKIGDALLGVDVQMNDEVRGIFDRLYASDAEIEAAKQEMPQRMFTTAEQAGMSKAEFEAYSKAIAKEAETAKEALLNRLMRDMAKEDQKDYQAEKDRVRAEVEAEFDARPEYAALKALSEGTLPDGETPIKLLRQTLVAKYGQDTVRQLGRGFNLVYTTDPNHPGAMDADAAAELLGYPSGDALVEALTGLKARGEAIKAEVQARMDAKEPSLLRDEEALRQAALEEMNGNLREQVLSTELRLLERKKSETKEIVKAKVGEVKAQVSAEEAARLEAEAAAEKAQREQTAQERRNRREAQAFAKISNMRLAAKTYISNMRLFEVRPDTFLQNQRRAASEAYTAALNNDYQKAAEAKERELLNHFLYREAVKAQEDAESFRDFTKRNDRTSVRAKMAKAGGDFLAQFDALRDRFGIQRMSNKAIQKKMTLAGWTLDMEQQAEDPLPLSPWMADESYTANYRELTVAQVRELHDELKNIKHLAYRQLYELIDGQRISREEMFEEFEAQFAKNLPNRKPLMLSSDPRRNEFKNKASAALQDFDSTMVKIQAIINWIDGYDVNGPAHRFIWNRLKKSYAHDLKLNLEIQDVITKAMESMPKEQRLGLTSDRYDVGMINPNTGEVETMTRGQILTMLLYSGQETRRTKLVEGYKAWGLTEAKLEAAFQNLHPADFKFAEAVWSSFDTLRPQIVELETRLKGVKPEWEANRPFEVYGKGGQLLAQLKGGYFPLVADPAYTGELGKKQEGGTVQQILSSNGYSRATTSTSHTKNLTAATYPLMLDYQRILTSELTNQIKDLSHREAILGINRIFSNKRFSDLVKLHVGEAYEAQLMPWLANIASDRNSGSTAGMAGVDRFFNAMRGNTTAAALGFKFGSVIVQLTDPMRVMAPGPYRVAAKFFSSAYIALAPGNPKREETIKMIRELSPFMAGRENNLDRDMRDRLMDLRGDNSNIAQWNRWSFWALGQMDKLASWPAWLGSYNQSMEKHGDSVRAAQEADRTVEMLLPSGLPMNLNAIQGQKHWSYKMITMFLGDAVVNYNLMRDAGHNINGLKGIPTLAGAGLVVILAQILGDLIKGQPPEDDESYAAWVARKAAMAPLSVAPVVRDVSGAIDSAIAGKPFTDYRFSPGITAVQKALINPAVNTIRLGKGKEDAVDYFINMGESLGYGLGVGGTVQATGSARYLKRYAEGTERPSNPAQFGYDVLRGKKKEKP